MRNARDIGQGRQGLKQPPVAACSVETPATALHSSSAYSTQDPAGPHASETYTTPEIQPEQPPSRATGNAPLATIRATYWCTIALKPPARMCSHTINQLYVQHTRTVYVANFLKKLAQPLEFLTRLVQRAFNTGHGKSSSHTTRTRSGSKNDFFSHL